MNYAGFWRRFAALMIDSIILLVPVVIGQIIFGHVELMGFAAQILYKPFFDSSSLMGTPGKIYMGIQVTTEAGGRLSFAQAIARFGLSLISGMFLGIGYLCQLFTQKRQTFHDLMVGAIVVRVEISTDQPWFEIWKQHFKTVIGQTSTAGKAHGTEPAVGETPPAAESSRADVLEAIDQLHRLYQQGAITEEEYRSKKEALLQKI